MDIQTWIILAGAIVLALAVFAAWLFDQRKQSRQLQQRFDPEYDWPANELGNEARAEPELKRREERLDIVPLAPSDIASFSYSWQLLQGSLVDKPKESIMQADQLVRELMSKRGYPIGDFERRAAEISVTHPAIVENYRAAQAIAARNARGQADTEERRQAVTHYRVLFDELLKTNADTPALMPATRIENADKRTAC